MACPFIIAAIRYEAETYCAQGLHQEALAVYDRFLANAKEIKPALRSTIEEAKKRIDANAMVHDEDENSRITDAEITRIKKSWSRDATINDIAVSAKALMDLGRHGHALEEYRRLLLTGRRAAIAVNGISKCLVHLISPEHFVEAVSIFVQGAVKSPKNRVLLKLLVAKNIDPHRYPLHLLSLYRHLTLIGPVSDEIQNRIGELGRIVADAGAATLSDDAYGPISNLNGLCHHLKLPTPKKNR